MSKPILYNTASYAFDAKREHTFEFQYSGAQVFSNTLTIRKNDTNEIVYSAAQTTMQLKHVLPAGVLTNGILYNVCVFVSDRDGAASETSDPLIFYCYSTPAFGINVEENQIITDSSYQIVIQYEQAEREALQSYQVVLYTADRKPVYTSPTQYDASLPLFISNLENNGAYYIRAMGETVNHMLLDTGYIFFMVKYIQPSYYSYLVAENNRKAGVIDLTSFIVSIEGATVDKTPPVFRLDDFIDTVEGPAVIFDHGFNINDDFIIRLCLHPCGQNVSPLKLSNGTLDILLTERRGIYWDTEGEEKLYYELSINSGNTYYIIKSRYVDIPSDVDILELWIKRKNNLYELYLTSAHSGYWKDLENHLWGDLSVYKWYDIEV